MLPPQLTWGNHLIPHIKDAVVVDDDVGFTEDTSFRIKGDRVGMHLFALDELCLSRFRLRESFFGNHIIQEKDDFKPDDDAD